MKKALIGLIIGIALSFSTVVFASDTIQAYLFPVQFKINGLTTDMNGEYSILNYDGHAYVPIRFVAEHLGATIDYDGVAKEIILKSNFNDEVQSDLGNISIGNIIVRKEGDNTNVVGQIKVAESLPSANIGANISFLDQNGKELGFIVINENLKAGINNFEAVGSGDFTGYASLKFHIGALNGRIVK